MKIGMAVNNLSISGGYQKLVLRLSEQLIKSGHEVSIYTLDVDRDKCYPEIIKKINIISLDRKNQEHDRSILKKITNLVLGRILLINDVRKLARLIPKDLDALIVHDEYCLHLLPWVNKKNGMRIIWMLNNQLSSNFDSGPEIFKGILSTPKKIKSLLIRFADLPQLLVALSLLNRATKKVDEFAVYDSINKKLVDQKIGRGATIVFAGADLEKFKTIFHNRTFSNKQEFTILSVGVFFPHRRHEDLIDAIASLKKDGIKANAIIVGRQDQDPEYSDMIINKINELGLERVVTCKKTVSDQEMLDLYKNSDIFCFINDGFTWGISVFEAIAAGLPVIITNNIGAADIIQNEISGFVINPRSPQEIADSIKKIINSDNKINSITHKAYDTTEELVSWESFSKRIVTLIHK